MSTNPNPFGGGGGQQPWQFTPEQNGGSGNGIIVTDAAITTGTPNLACTTSNPFTGGSAGMPIIIMGAGAAAAPLLTTISSVTDAGHVVLAANAGTTVSGKGAIFGTDNTAAIKSAISAAVSYAQAHAGYAEVIFQPLIYCVSGAATVGGTTKGNAIFPIPLVDATVKPKVVLSYRGLQSDNAALIHFQQPTIQVNGSTLAILRLDGTLDATFGPASVIGGPFQGYGAVSSVFNNLQPVIDNIQILVPFNSTFGGFDFFGSAEARIRSAAVLPMATIVSGSPWPQVLQANITNQWTFGAKMPDTNNNDRCDVGNFSCEGLTYGIMPSEHTTIESVRAINCIIGIQGYSTSSMPHGAHVHYASAEACAQSAGALSTGAGVKMQIDQLDIEGPVSNILFDPSNNLTGEIRFRNLGLAYTTSGVVSGGANARLVNLDNASGPVASPQAPPASNAAWVNGYWRDAWITLSATTITALKIDTIAQNGLAGSPATYTFLLPSGHSYTPTFTGTLTHTVSLI